MTKFVGYFIPVTSLYAPTAAAQEPEQKLTLPVMVDLSKSCSQTIPSPLAAQLPRVAVQSSSHCIDGRVIPPDEGGRHGRAVQPHRKQGTVLARTGRLRAVWNHSGC